jgi:septum formation protein
VVAERIVLASRSPRRVQLLTELGVEPLVDPADVDETPHSNEDPVSYVRRVAVDKARRVAQRHADATVIAADTTVDIDGRILGQPADINEARSMLRSLSARTHRVHTAVVVITSHVETTEVVTSLVTFQPLDDETLEWYLATGESMGKAGAYAIQGQGSVLVERVQGSMSNVVGLPLASAARLLGLQTPPKPAR